MNLLAVDTALGACSVALLSTNERGEEELLSHRFKAMERGHAEALAPMVEDALRQSGIGINELDRLAVTTGPGTFTGQRVGLAFMRGLRIAVHRDLIGITTLDAMAFAAMAATKQSLGACLHDAKRGETYLGLATSSGTLIAPCLVRFDEAITMLTKSAHGRSIALAGTAGPLAAERLSQNGVHAIATSIMHPDALWVGRLARDAVATDAVPKPLYLRPPDAKLPA